MPCRASSWATRSGPWSGSGEGVIEDGLFNLRSDPIGMSPLHLAICRATLGAIGLVVTANFVELLTAVADELAGFADVIELFGEL